MLGFPVAVVRKFADDQAGSLAALVAYYGFFSLFPLLLVFVTVLGFVLQGDPQAQRQVLDSELGQFPVIGHQLHIHSLSGSGFALAVGIAGSLLAGLGVTQATQNAFDQIWAVPHKHRPSFVARRLRGFALLMALGILSLLSTAVSELTSGEGSSILAGLAGETASLVINVILFFVAFRLLTAAEVRTSDLLVGVLTAAVLWTLLQTLGGYLVGHQLKGQNETYGVFALVIGLLSWLYLGAQITLFAAELNVVKARGLWPRGLLAPPADADRKTLHGLAKIEERVRDETVEVTFAEQPPHA